MTATTPTYNDLLEVTIPGHGYYRVHPSWIDHAMQQNLPTSIAALRARLTEQTECDYSDVSTLFELLVVWADCNRPSWADYSIG